MSLMGDAMTTGHALLHRGTSGADDPGHRCAHRQLPDPQGLTGRVSPGARSLRSSLVLVLAAIRGAALHTLVLNRPNDMKGPDSLTNPAPFCCQRPAQSPDWPELRLGCADADHPRPVATAQAVAAGPAALATCGCAVMACLRPPPFLHRLDVRSKSKSASFTVRSGRPRARSSAPAGHHRW